MAQFGSGYSSIWTSQPNGTGPGTASRLFELGAWSATAAQGWWSLAVSPDGTRLGFLTQDANGQTTILQAPIRWHFGEWQQIALSWSAQATVLFVDGLRAAAGPGVALAPLTSFTGIQGFCIGSDVHGGQVAGGQFEEVFTFDRACSDLEVAADYARTAPLAALGPITVEEEQAMIAAASMMQTTPLVVPNATESLIVGAQECCGLTMKIDLPSTNGLTPVHLTNTWPNRAYQILSTTRLPPTTNWTIEQTVIAQNTFVDATITNNSRSNLFLLALDPGISQHVFQGLSYDTNDPVAPPDTMGAVGPDYFVELLNGKVVVFDKSGVECSETDSKVFFRIDDTFPHANHVYDPRILYDHHSNCWVASGIDAQIFKGSNEVILAVSKDSCPLPLPTTNGPGNWTKHFIDFGPPDQNSITDFDTLGLDGNGIYVSAIKIGSAGSNTQKIVAIRKSVLYTNHTTQFLGESSQSSWYKFWSESSSVLRARKTVQAAVNFDPVAPNGYALFVVKGEPQQEAPPNTPYRGGAIRYRRLKWPGATGLPNWVPNEDWQDIPEPTQRDYRDYFDLDGGTNTAPQLGGRSPVQLGAGGSVDTVGSALSMAVIRDGYLWTCQHVALDGTNGTYSGGSEGNSVDRTAIQWVKLSVATNSSGLSYSDHGRILDRAQDDPRFYYYPSLMVNELGDVLMGFSGSSANSYINAYYSLKPSGEAASPAICFQLGEGFYEDQRWGDYSYTSLDPTDSQTLWTVQQVSGLPAVDHSEWKTAVARVHLEP